MQHDAVKEQDIRRIRRTPLKERMRRGEHLLGSFVFLPSPAIVEILAEAGLDFIIIDLEHSPKSWETVENMVRAAQLYDLPALIRVYENTPQTILHALEVGASGIMVPFIEKGDDVRKAIKAMRYPPDGNRGTCTQTRAARYGSLRSGFVGHAARQNDELVVIGLIESSLGVKNIGDILAVENGLDCVLIGRSDLATDLGHAGQTENPAVQAATDSVLRAITASQPKTGAQAAMAVYAADECEKWRQRGCSVFMSPSESGLLLGAVRTWRESAQATLTPV